MSALRPVVSLTALAVLGAAVLPACVQVRESDVVSLDAAGINLVSARNDRGDIRVFADRSGSTFEVEGTVWGGGSRRAAAEDRQETVRWDAQIDRDVLVIDGIAPGGRRGVDFSVVGPEIVDLDLFTDSGTIEVGGIEGIHDLSGSSVRGTVIGDAFITASSSVDIDFVPYAETDMIIESGSSVTLAIPFGLDYDLTVRGDPNDTITVDELGWDELVLGEGFINGYRGFGDVEIDIRANGPVRIVELR